MLNSKNAPGVDLDSLPAFNGSFEENIFITFNTIPIVGERYFLPQNSLIDAAIITGIRPHYFDRVPPLTYDMDNSYTIDGVVYNVIGRADYTNILLSLANKRNSIKIQRLPISSLEILPTSPAPGINEARPKPRKAFYLMISSRQCFIEFTNVPVTALPFVVPISFNYTLKKL